MDISLLDAKIKNYASKARVDRLYTDPITGSPWLGIEIQAKDLYHNDENAKWRDETKKIFFELAQIPLAIMKIYGQIRLEEWEKEE